MHPAFPLTRLGSCCTEIVGWFSTACTGYNQARMSAYSAVSHRLPTSVCQPNTIGPGTQHVRSHSETGAACASVNVLQVRDALYRLTGVQYDSVLINYYADGKCGMRYHVDPLYGR